jgi:hypothetical protein
MSGYLQSSWPSGVAELIAIIPGRGKEKMRRTFGRTAFVQLNTRVGEWSTWPRFVKSAIRLSRRLEFYVTLIFVEFHRGRKLKRETRPTLPTATKRFECSRERASRSDRFPPSFAVSTLSIQKYKLRKFHPGTAAT